MQRERSILQEYARLSASTSVMMTNACSAWIYCGDLADSGLKARSVTAMCGQTAAVLRRDRAALTGPWMAWLPLTAQRMTLYGAELAIRQKIAGRSACFPEIMMPATRLLWSAVAALALSPPALGQSATPELFVPLQGTWIVDSAEQDGTPVDVRWPAKLTIGDDSFELQTAAVEFRGKIRIRTDVSPKQIDFLLTSGRVWRGIFVVTAKLLRVNYVDAAAATERPKLFATSADAPGMLLVMRRN
jgi:uncharacterized protein (TIGR03067 family)